jgi:hypothetical protein
MLEQVFTKPDVLNLTRITEHFEHRLMRFRVRRPGDERFSDPNPAAQYVRQATVRLATQAGYDFAENAGGIQEHVRDLAVLVSVDSFTLMAD